jgi:cytochrome c oxidase subunit IV
MTNDTSARQGKGTASQTLPETDTPPPSGPKTRHRQEGPRNHYLTFMASIMLTMLAFAAVVYGGMSKAFLVPFLILMAVVQVVMQLAYWMHMKDRGHVYSIIGLIFGVIITLTAIAAAVYWVWI